MKEQTRLTSNNFLRLSSSRDGSVDSVSDLISNTNSVVAGGSFSILRLKQIKLGNNSIANKPLSNDIESLIKEFHNDADTFKEVSKLIFIKISF